VRVSSKLEKQLAIDKCKDKRGQDGLRYTNKTLSSSL